MRSLRSASLLLAAALGASLLLAQNVNLEHPPEINAQKHATPEEIRDRVAKVQFQKDLRELSDLCTSVPRDLDALKQGVVSRDAIDRFKRMEKLSKHVREQLSRD